MGKLSDFNYAILNYLSTKNSKNLVFSFEGGPTAEARGCLELPIQYWTSRGWAFVDVNYGGSTGWQIIHLD